MNDITITYTELGFVDIKKYLYDILTNYHPLLEKGITKDKVWYRKSHYVAKEGLPFITILYRGGSTNSIGIRTTIFQFDIRSSSIEEGEPIYDIIIDLFNRRNLHGIRSIIDRDYGIRTDASIGNSKTNYVRHSVEFEFVFKDMKY